MFVESIAFQPGDYLSGVAVLELERPLAVKEVVVGLRCHGRVSVLVVGQQYLEPRPRRPADSESSSRVPSLQSFNLKPSGSGWPGALHAVLICI